MEHVKTNAIKLAVQAWPDAAAPPERTVVCIHGLTSNHTVWLSMVDALAPRRRLVAYDLRGRGDSDKPASGYSLAMHDADLLGLLDHLGLARATLMGHSLGAHIAMTFAANHPDRVAKLVLFDGGLDVRAEVLDSLAPAVARLGVEFPSLDGFLERLRALPMFAGRWNDYLVRHYTYDVERTPGGGVQSKVPRHAIEEEVANLQRERLWVRHHRVQAPTLLLRAPDGLLTATDCLMTQDEAEAMAHAIPHCRLVVVPGTNHYTILLSANELVRREVDAFLAA
jgi:pimeloyl-ACP methyl ester carboxylesterase